MEARQPDLILEAGAEKPTVHSMFPKLMMKKDGPLLPPPLKGLSTREVPEVSACIPYLPI